MYLIENIDATVIAQKPKLLPYIDTMVKNVAEALHLEEDQVNIKATTEEGLGFTGKKEGISAQAICCISKALDRECRTTGSQADAAAAQDAQRTQKNKREMRLHKAGRCGRLEEE